MDAVVFEISFTSFIYFILLHSLILVFSKKDHVLVVSQILYVLILGYGLSVSYRYGLGISLLSVILLSLLIWVYVLAISSILFDTSIYLKMISVLEGEESLDDLLKKYNSKDVLDVNLKRLLASGEIQFDSGVYYLSSKQGRNIFLIDSIRQGFKELINTSSI